MSIVAFDIDEVLFPLKDVLIETAKNTFNENIQSREYLEFSIVAFLSRRHPEIWQKIESLGGLKYFFSEVNNSGMLLSTLPSLGSFYVFSRLRKMKYKIGIATYRGTKENPHSNFKDGLAITEKWLRLYGLNYDAIEFTDKKPEGLKKIEESLADKVLFYVEDHPLNIIKTVAAGYRTVIINKTYNQRQVLDEGHDSLYGNGNFTQEEWEKTLDSGLVDRVNSVYGILKLLPKR